MYKIKGVLIDATTNTAAAAELEDSLDSYYEALHCSTIDIVERSIAGRYFTIVCDDEGLLTEHPQISAVDDDLDPMLVGSLFVVGSDYDSGELASLSDDEIDHVLDHVNYAISPYRECLIPILTEMGY